MDQLRLRARSLRNHATDAERHLWQRLRLAQFPGFKFRRQVPIAGYVADFVCVRVKLIVELDGGQHPTQSGYDANRTRALEKMGYCVVRYWNDEVLLRTDDVLEDLLRALRRCVESTVSSKVKSTPPQPSPSLREREGANGNSTNSTNSTNNSTNSTNESCNSTGHRGCEENDAQ